jgi:tRNA G18 (ribose-2'-O)-methylase SpoU
MNVVKITSTTDERVAVFATLTEAQLRNRLNANEGLFIAESPKVINVALDAGYTPVSLLCEERHIQGDAAPIIARCPADMPIYTGERDVLASLTGYKLTRGVLCAMRRRPDLTVEQVCRGARRIAVIDSVVDTTNIGAIFRSAAALGIDGVLLTRTSCDPLNRRAVRVSMGSVFLVPWTWLDAPISSLRDYGFKTVALALTDKSVSIDDATLCAQPQLALVLGTEGDGLAHNVIADADFVARIPMAHNVDSLNVAAASAVALWQLRSKPRQPATF